MDIQQTPSHARHRIAKRHRDPVSREEIAQYIGTATESLIRTLSDFKSEKLIDIREGKIHIIDMQKLQNLIY